MMWLLLALRLALGAGALEIEAPRRLVLPGEVCSACRPGLVLPASVALPPSAIPALAPAGDGARVAPQIVTPETQAREPELHEAARALSRDVNIALPALKESVKLGEWRGPNTTLDQPCCGDAAPKLGLLLKGMGYGVHVVEAEMHYYLLQTLAGGQLIVDPTIRQFFGGARAPPEVPTVFVGTVGQLNALFEKHAAAKTTRYAMSRIYFGEAQVRNARIQELETALDQRPARADMGPLKSFLNTLGKH